MSKPKLIRITTVPTSLKILLKGQLSYMNNHYEVIGISSDGTDLNDVAITEGIRVIPVFMTRTISPLKDMISVWKLYKIFRTEKPLIVHTHTPKAGIVGMLAARLAGVKIRLHTVAGLPLMETKGLKRFILELVEKTTYAFATGVYSNSHGLFEFITDAKFCKNEKIKVIASGSSNGIDISYFDPENISESEIKNFKKNLAIDANDFVFIFVGRLVGDKGLNELVQAFKQISLRIENCKLLLLGETENNLDPLLPKTLIEIENNPKIITLGFQGDVRPYLAISNVLVFPTYREGFPNVVMQAGAMGLPAIVTNINGCNEIIIEGKNGYLIPVKNTAKLVSAMADFFEDKGIIVKGSICRQMIVNRYQQSIVWEDLLNDYKTREASVS